MPKPPAFTGPDLCALEAHEVVALLRAGEIDPQAALDAASARIKAVGPQINATPTLCLERAAKAAAAVDPQSPLAGLPISIKDLTPVAGVRTTFGTPGLAEFIPEASDPLVERLEARGGVVVGKTNTPELGAGGVTFNPVLGVTRNPWDLRLNPGGSSGGAAASLAAGEIWLAHGSDHGGSLRTPAAYCGVVGLRPSPGRAGGGPPDCGFIIEGVQGPMARSVRDCALFLDAMAGFEPRFPISYPAPETPFQQAVVEASGKIRIGFAPDLGGFGPVEPEMAAHLAAALGKVEANGAQIEEIAPELPHLERTYHALRGLMWATKARRLPAHIRDQFKETLRRNTEFGESLSINDLCDAELDRSALYDAACALLSRFDVIACPVVGNMPRPVEEEWPREIAGVALNDYMDWLRFAFLATVTGLPAMSVPVGLTAVGLPVGLQLIGPPRGEARLLAAGRAVEVAVGGPLGPIDPV